MNVRDEGVISPRGKKELESLQVSSTYFLKDTQTTPSLHTQVLTFFFKEAMYLS